MSKATTSNELNVVTMETNCQEFIPEEEKEKSSTQQTQQQRKLVRSHALEENVVEDNNLIEFIKETLNKSVKDRNIILRIETDLIQFVKDESRSNLPFPSMSSYHRMLVHRISTLFELDHNIDPIGNCVVVSKSNGKSGKLLTFRFKELIQSLSQEEEESKKITIIQREGQLNNVSKENSIKESKSYNERSEDYNKIRRRIFEDSEKSEIWTGQNNQNKTKLIKVESFETAVGQGQNQNQGQNQIQNGRNKIQNFKSYSFGGYGGGQQQKVTSQTQHHNGLGFKQDSSSSSLSPASSGYKSQQSYDVVSPPPIQNLQPQQNTQTSQLPQQQQIQQGVKVLWAVTDLTQLPPGAILIDPQTGQTMTTPMALPNPTPPQLQPPPPQIQLQQMLPPQLQPPPQMPPQSYQVYQNPSQLPQQQQQSYQSQYNQYMTAAQQLYNNQSQLQMNYNQFSPELAGFFQNLSIQQNVQSRSQFIPQQHQQIVYLHQDLSHRSHLAANPNQMQPQLQLQPPPQPPLQYGNPQMQLQMQLPQQYIINQPLQYYQQQQQQQLPQQQLYYQPNNLPNTIQPQFNHWSHQSRSNKFNKFHK